VNDELKGAGKRRIHMEADRNVGNVHDNSGEQSWVPRGVFDYFFVTTRQVEGRYLVVSRQLKRLL
jgi:hypothetical protein